jgi:hypothetical protein
MRRLAERIADELLEVTLAVWIGGGLAFAIAGVLSVSGARF